MLFKKKYSQVYNYHQNLILEHFHPLERNPVPMKCPPPLPWGSTNQLLVSTDLPALDVSCKWNRTVRSSLIGSFHLFVMFPRFIHVAACVSTVSFYCWTIVHRMDTPHFIFPFISLWTWAVSTFWLLWIWCYEYSCTCFVQMYIFTSLGIYIPKSRSAGSYLTLC